MCGIYGTTLKYSSSILNEKLKKINFRGPDFCAIKEYRIPNSTKGDVLTFGHVRLSIIDLDSRSNQPFDYNENISIVFNGEIYNYKDLRKQYLADVKFRTESDTEVICAMYEKFGIDSIKYLNGMFAFVIYDKAKQILFGVRDRLGKKPLYYWHSEKGFEFASQLKSISYANNFEISEQARRLYLLHGYIPDPFCIFKEVKKLRAGNYFVYNIDSFAFETHEYWNIFYNSCGFSAPRKYEEAKETVRELLFDSVGKRLVADVPVGMFLSGGIDSSIVCAIVSKLNRNICAYTIGFENAKFDESSYAIEVAKSLDVPIKVNYCSGEEQQKIFDDYILYYDEPFCDPSMIPTCLVAQKARENVTVALGGDGGDELFFGYTKYDYIQERIEQYKKPYLIRKILSPYYLWKKGERDMIFSTQRDYADVYRSEGVFVYDFGGAEKFDRIESSKIIPDRDIFRKEREILSYSDYDMKFFLNAMNQKIDRASMRCSLELRAPLMDYRLAEYSRLLPFNYLKGKYGMKTILKDILYDMVPKELLERPKMGFTPPTADWFRGSLKERLLDVVTIDNVQNLLPELDAKKYLLLRDEFLSGSVMDARRFWAVYTYINWYNTYVG